MDNSSRLIRRARHDAGVTQARLAELTGIQQPRLSQYENGTVTPSASTMNTIVNALDVRPSIHLEVARYQIIETVGRFHGVAVWVFGPCVDGTDTPQSEAGLLIRFGHAASTYDLADLTTALELLLGVRVTIRSARAPSASALMDEAIALGSFEARPHDPSPSTERELEGTLDLIRGLLAEVQVITDQGRESFFAAANGKSRIQAISLLLQLSDAARMHDIAALQSAFRSVNWAALRIQRDLLESEPDDIDFDTVWMTIAGCLPREQQLLGPTQTQISAAKPARRLPFRRDRARKRH